MSNGQSDYCGIDFGTSNSTIGIVSNKPELVALEDNKLDMPTTIFFDDHEPRPLFGREAIASYIDGNTGRFMRSMKSVLGSSLMSTNVGGSNLQFERVIAVYIKELKNRAEACRGGEPIHQVVMGRPVHFVDDSELKDAQAQASLEKAAKLAGFKQVEFQFEPIAAALAYESTLSSEELALIIDIGGGTSDFTVIRLSPKRGEKSDRAGDILGTSGIHIGGTDLDKLLSLDQVMPHFGFRARNMRKPTMELPHPPFFNFASWHLINTLYEKSAMLEIKTMRQDIENKQLIDRFIKVIERREAHLVGLAVEAAKVGLSDADVANMDLAFVEQGFQIEVGKQSFNDIIRPSCADVVEAMGQCLNNAGIKPEEVGSIFLTGGTTSVELFRQNLIAGFDNAKVVDGDKFGSVGLGLTLHAQKLFA